MYACFLVTSLKLTMRCVQLFSLGREKLSRVCFDSYRREGSINIKMQLVTVSNNFEVLADTPTYFV